MNANLEDISARLVVQHVVLRFVLQRDPQLLASLRATRPHLEDGLATISVTDTWLASAATAFDQLLEQ